MSKGTPSGTIAGDGAARYGERRPGRKREVVVLLGIEDEAEEEEKEEEEELSEEEEEEEEEEDEEEEEERAEALSAASEGSTEGEEVVFDAGETVVVVVGASTCTALEATEDSPVPSPTHESHNVCDRLRGEKERLEGELMALMTTQKQKEQSFQDIYHELEQKCFDQQESIDSLRAELEVEHAKACEKLTSSEDELVSKVHELTRQCEAASQEQEGVVSKLALLEAEKRKLVDQIVASEQAQKDATKESERLQSALKKLRSEMAKMKSSHDKAESKRSEHARELARAREEAASLNVTLKRAQSKLKAETETHKKTEAALLQTGKRLKEAREEGEQIRADLKTMITQYQMSEEMRSNSLGRQLQKTERELKQHEQEIADQQELHELTVKELDLVKAGHKIALEESQQYKDKIAELNGRLLEQVTEVEELRGVIVRQKADQKKLLAGVADKEQLNQCIEIERSKMATVRDSYAQLQKRKEYLERELERRKDREEELLTFSERLSSANAELQTEKSSWEAKTTALVEERDSLATSLVEVQRDRAGLADDVGQLRQESEVQVASLLDQLEAKSKAVEQLSMSLEEEREQTKATRRKNGNNIKDLHRQLQQCKRRIEHLEVTRESECEPPATLPVTDGDRASSNSSLDGIGPAPVLVATAAMGRKNGVQLQLSDEDLCRSSPSPELFLTLDREKTVLVERLCRLKRELARKDERMGFYEEHSQQLTEDIQRKSKIIQSFIVREQSGVLAPPSPTTHGARPARKSGIMAAVFSGRPSRTSPEMTLELSMEMNRKMQSVLEDTLLTNITLKESIETLGNEVQRLSAQLHAHESSPR